VNTRNLRTRFVSRNHCVPDRRSRRFFALLFVVLLFASALLAGSKKTQDYGLVFGTVWSAQNQAVQGVTIKIRRANEKKARWTLISDHRGEFAQRVPAEKADYVVWAELPRHKGPVAETTVHIESNERADIGLHLK
jgi:hypothetical protein